jgi:hypothetical protein
MPNTPLTRRQGAGLAKMIIIGLLVQIAVIGYVFYQSYAGREEVVTSQRKGCESRRASSHRRIRHRAAFGAFGSQAVAQHAASTQ